MTFSQRFGSSSERLRERTRSANSSRRFWAMVSVSWSVWTTRALARFSVSSIGCLAWVWASRSWVSSGLSGGAPSAGFGPSCCSRVSIAWRRGDIPCVTLSIFARCASNSSADLVELRVVEHALRQDLLDLGEIGLDRVERPVLVLLRIRATAHQDDGREHQDAE